MRNYFVFDGEDSRDYDVYISGSETFDSPTRSFEMISIPGRDGDLLATGSRLQNTSLTYPAFTYNPEKLAAFRSMLMSRTGYVRLTDSYHPDEYRLAVYRGSLEPDMMDNLKVGEFDVTFEVMPQRWLLEGESPLLLWEYDGLTDENDVELTDENDVEIEAATTQIASGSLVNPSPMAARPLIISTGPGTVTLGDQVITIDVEAGVTVYIDCEMMDAYTMSGDLMVSANQNVVFSGNDFPTLKAGETNVTYTTAGLEIVPRWWRV